VNYALMVACLGVAIGFGESSSLAGAYGIAVTGTMIITSILYLIVITRVWRWSLWLAAPLVTVFLVFDISYFGANLLKVKDGGWFTLLAAGLLTIAMTTWRKGRSEVIRRFETRIPLELFLDDVARKNPPRVENTAVFMSVAPEWTSPVLLHNLKYNKVLHKKVVLLSILSTDVPTVSASERVKVEDLGQDFYRVVAYNGFMQRPNVPEIMKLASNLGLPIDEAETTYYVGRVSLFTTGDSRMMRWRKVLFAFMLRNAAPSATYYVLPANRFVELGSQIQL
jgi:KUP system potassium uptake protein